MTCPDCNGRGAVEKRFLLFFTRTAECERCDGIGIVPSPRPKTVSDSPRVLQHPTRWHHRAERPGTLPASAIPGTSYSPSPAYDDSALMAAAVSGAIGGDPLTAGVTTALTGNLGLGVLAGELGRREDSVPDPTPSPEPERCSPPAEEPPAYEPAAETCAVPESHDSSSGYDSGSYDSGSSDSGSSDSGSSD